MTIQRSLGCLILAVYAATPLAAAGPPAPLTSQLLAQGVQEIVFAVRQPGKDPHWYANFGYYADSPSHLTYGNGGRLCRLNLTTHTVTTILEDKLGGVRDPAVHYDAQRILFSYRPSGSAYYHLYEIGVDGRHPQAGTRQAGAPRQLTFGPYDDIEPCYLPDNRIAFISSRANRWVNCWLTQVATLHRCDADGRNIRAISANIEHDNTPWPLPDGRVLHLRWEYVDRSQVDYHHLWTANPDGTNETVFFGNLHPGTVMIDAKPIPDSKKIVAVFSPGHGQTEHAGYITVVDPGRGPDEPQGARNVTAEAHFRDPWAFSEDLFMAAAPQRIVLLDNRGRAEEIYQLDKEDAAAGLDVHEPRPLIARQRETIIPDRSDPSSSTGTLLLTNVYNGRNMEGVRPGEIKKLLVLETLPKPINYSGGMEPLTYGGSFTLERVLGTVPVEEDGSASIELPALRPVFFVALDKNDLAVKRMQSFTTVQPGEVSGCIGCHEQRTHTSLTRDTMKALSRPPSRIERITDCPDVLDFPRDIQPILDRLCNDCHGCEKTARGGPYEGRVMLTGDHGPMYSHAYVTMTDRHLFSDNRNQPRSNYPPRALGSSASRILKMVDGSHHGAVADEHQRKLLRLWIDTSAPYPGTYAAIGCGSIGSYFANTQINGDWEWPASRAAAAVIDRRCASCHQGPTSLPRVLSDERNVSNFRFDVGDPGLRMNRHLVFNLTRPERSLILMAPLAEAGGGWGLCRDKQGRPANVLASTSDPDYKALQAMVTAGAERLDKIKRFDMPGFRPTPEYLREMKRYGVLADDHADSAKVDGYTLDQRYWESLQYVPSGIRRSLDATY